MTDIAEETRLRAAIDQHLNQGRLFADLSRRVAMRTISWDRRAGPALRTYLEVEILPTLASLGFQGDILVEPDLGPLPFLIARRDEDPALPTVLLYGHGDVVRAEQDWSEGLDPWVLTQRGDRLYGRGAADNKGQHSVTLAALAILLGLRGRLGFNVVFLMEMGEEAGSPGLEAFCQRHAGRLKADVLIASDGPRWSRARPTLFLGARGAMDVEISVDLRERAYHASNWGGWLRNAGHALARAITVLTDERGRPTPDAFAVPAAALAFEGFFNRLIVPEDAGLPAPDPGWGDCEASPAARLLNRNNLEILTLELGDPAHLVYALGPAARALCHISFLPETKPETLAPAMQACLTEAGLADVRVRPTGFIMPASRTRPDHPVVGWTLRSMRRWSGKDIDFLPNFGGALPNWVFSDVLGLPTLWIPHSYNGCAQHSPDEHALVSVLHEGLTVMAGLLGDIGADPGRFLALARGGRA